MHEHRVMKSYVGTNSFEVLNLWFTTFTTLIQINIKTRTVTTWRQNLFFLFTNQVLLHTRLILASSCFLEAASKLWRAPSKSVNFLFRLLIFACSIENMKITWRHVTLLHCRKHKYGGASSVPFSPLSQILRTYYKHHAFPLLIKSKYIQRGSIWERMIWQVVRKAVHSISLLPMFARSVNPDLVSTGIK